MYSKLDSVHCKPQNPVDNIELFINEDISGFKKRCLMLFFILANHTEYSVGCILARLSRVSYSMILPEEILVPLTSAVARYVFVEKASTSGFIMDVRLLLKTDSAIQPTEYHALRFLNTPSCRQMPCKVYRFRQESRTA